MSGSLDSLGVQVDAVYRAVLGRPVDDGALQYWEQAISSGQRSLSDVQSYLETTPEAQADAAAIQQLYEGEVGRAASDGEVGDRETDLSYGATLGDLQQALSIAPDTVAAIEGLYQTVLGRAADAGGLATQEGHLAQGTSLADVRTDIAHSDEAAGDISYRFSTELGRAAQGFDLTFWEGHLATDTALASIQTAFADSPDAAAQIQTIYEAEVWRPADPGELGQRQAELSAGATLDNLRAGLAHTDTAINDINYLYQQVLGRNADPAGLVAQQNALAQAASLNDIRTNMANSAEAAGDITYLIRTEVGRTATAGDIAYWAGRLATDTSLAGMQTDYAYSDEAAAKIQDIYQGVLGRAASDIELNDQQNNLNSGTSLDDLQFFLSRTGEAVFDIQSLFVQVLGRTAGDGEISDRQDELANGQTLAGLRASIASSPEAANDIQAIFQAVLGRAADANEVASWQQALCSNAGWTLTLVGPSLVTSAVNSFYQGLFGRNAPPSAVLAFEGALAAGESLQTQFAYLRPIFATGDYETSVVDQFYQGIVGRDATSGELGVIEGALSAGQSLAAVEANLTPAVVSGIQALYQQDLGRAAGLSEVQFWEGQLGAGLSMAALNAAVAFSPEGVIHIQALWQQDFGRYASVSEVEGYQQAEASGLPAGSQFTVSTPAGLVLATADARTIIAEAGAYVTLSAGLTPMLTGPDGGVVRFRNAAEFDAYALGMAARAGQATSATLATYDLTQSWLKQIDQVDIQAAANLQTAALADQAAGNYQQAYLESIGAQLATQIQQTAPGQRRPQSVQVMIGQIQATVQVTDDESDPSGRAGFGYILLDTDPERTALIAQATAEAAAGQTAGAAGNQLLAFLDDAQARVDLAYAALPQGARTDKMLAVAQQFVDAGQQAAAQGNWNLVQTLETAADVSLKIAAEPVDQRTAMTERFVHEGTKHDITVDPNTLDPFRSFKDHSKGQDFIGAIIEGVVGVVINVLAVFPSPLQVFAIPAAVAWDTAQAGQSFSEGNLLGGVLGLASAAGVGLVGLEIVSEGAAPGSFLADATTGVGQFAQSLGFTATATATATQELGETVLAGTGLVGGAAGIAQSAGSGDALGIAAGILEVTAAIAGGLVSTNALSPGLAGIARTIATGAGIASLTASATDAFARGDLAGGLASSLNALVGLVAQSIGQSQDTPAALVSAADDLPNPQDVVSSSGTGETIGIGFSQAPPGLDTSGLGLGDVIEASAPGGGGDDANYELRRILGEETPQEDLDHDKSIRPLSGSGPLGPKEGAGVVNAGGLKRTSSSDLKAAANADGYSSVELWKTQQLQLNSRSDIVKDSAGNLYSIPRQGTGAPQPLDVKLPK